MLFLFPRYYNSLYTLFIYLFFWSLTFPPPSFDSQHNYYGVVNMVFPDHVWKQWIPMVSCLNSSSDKPEKLLKWKGFLIIISTSMSGFSLSQRMVWSCRWLKRVCKGRCPIYVHVFCDCMNIIKPVQLHIPLNLHVWLPPAFCTSLSQMHHDYLIWGCSDKLYCVSEVLVYTFYRTSLWYFGKHTQELFLSCFLPPQLFCRVSHGS